MCLIYPRPQWCCLQIDPARHPGICDLLCLVHETHVEKQLNSSPGSALESTEEPSMCERGSLTDKDSVKLRLVEGRKVQVLLREDLHCEGTGVVLILLSALAGMIACPILFDDGTVDFGQCLLDISHVLLFGHGTGDGCFIVRQVGS